MSECLKIEGRLDAVTVSQWEAPVLALSDESDVCLDLTAVEYISSAGLRLVLRLAKRLHEREQSLKLTGVQPAVHHVLEMSGFLAFLTVETA
ncbi:MAG: STAS domain-containing protein [Hydrogenovibrio sp.]